jgi:hypothetical protein
MHAVRRDLDHLGVDCRLAGIENHAHGLRLFRKRMHRRGKVVPKRDTGTVLDHVRPPIDGSGIAAQFACQSGRGGDIPQQWQLRASNGFSRMSQPDVVLIRSN